MHDRSKKAAPRPHALGWQHLVTGATEAAETPA